MRRGDGFSANPIAAGYWSVMPEPRRASIFMAGTKWAQPLEADFKKRLTKFKESYVTPRQWAEELAVKCQKSFSRSAILDNYAKLTDALGIR